MRDAGCWRSDRLDLAELDAEAADLDLVVDAAEELEVAARQPSAPDRRCGRGGRPCRPKGSATKRSAVRSGAVQIAARDAGAADVDLAGHADGNGLLLPIEQVESQVRDRHADDAARAGVDVGPRDAAGR